MNPSNHPKLDRSIREKDIETYLNQQARKIGAITHKWSSPSQRGVPDRIVIHNGLVMFIELKAPGQKPTTLQASVHKKLREHGACVAVADSFNAVDDLLAVIKKYGGQ